MMLRFLLLAVYFFSTLPLHGSDVLSEVDGERVLSLDSLLTLPINTVSKSWQTLRVAPASITIITGQDIERFGYRTIADVVRTVRGMYTNYDRRYSYIGVRGFSRSDEYNSRLLVLLNGHYLNDNVTGIVGAGYDLPLNMEAIERIEIVRGPGSVVYGTGAMFAVINIVTKTGRVVDGIGISTEIGSFGYKQVGIRAGTVLNDMDVSIAGVWGDVTGQDLYFPEYDTVTTNLGRAQNLDGSSHYSIMGKASYGSLALQGYASFRRKFIPTAPYGTIFNYPNMQTVDNYALLEASYGIEVNENMLVTLRGSYNTFGYRENAAYEDVDDNGVPITVIEWYNYKNKWLGAEARLQWDIWANNRLIVGAEYKRNMDARYDVWIDKEKFVEDSLAFSVWSAYLQEEYQIAENVNLTGAMRLDYYPEDGKAISKREAGITVSPKVGVIVNATPTTVLKFLYGSGFRTPIFDDRVSENNAGQIDTIAVETERVHSWEIVAEQQIGRDWYIIGSVYDNNIQHVYKEFLAVEERTLPYWPLTNVRSVGAEIEVNTRLVSGTRAYGSYSFQKVWDRNDTTQPSNSPMHLIKIGFSQTVVESLNVSLEALYESSRSTVQHTTTGAYTLTTAQIAYRPFPMVELSVVVRNLLDTKYALPSGWEYRQASITQDGRNVTAKIRLDL